MKTRYPLLSVLLLSFSGLARAEETVTLAIDLDATLRLVSAQNLDVLISRERLKLAEAGHDEARLRFFPWVETGLGYQRHEGNIQETSGNILDVSRQSYNAGAGATAQVELGDAIYDSLSTRRLADAAGLKVEVTRQGRALEAATAYFELARARSAVGVAVDGVRLAGEYAEQVGRAVEAGLTFKGDSLRAQSRIEKNRILVRQAEEEEQIASARLAQILQLDPATVLRPREAELVPLALVDERAALSSLVAAALAGRPELAYSEALVDAARRDLQGAKYGPLIPTIGARANVYGLGGGPGSDWGNFDDGEDYAIGLHWRIGPGGLFDRTRIRAAEAREEVVTLEQKKIHDAVRTAVIEARVRAQSLADQVGMARKVMASSQEMLTLSRERKEFGVGVVLEAIQSEEDYTEARLGYLRLVAAQNQAQFALHAAIGGLKPEGGAK